MNSVRAITIDLDDTLWDIAPVIAEAEKRVLDWLTRHCPEVVDRHGEEGLREERRKVEAEHPELRHDLTVMRKLTLERVLLQCGYDAALAEPAFEEFMHARNNVSLFPDVTPALERLSRKYPLVSISNGNADLGRIGLRRFFTACVSAREVGVAKPHPEVFLAACKRARQQPGAVIHVGDHPYQDVLGASQVGMRTVWVNRQGETWDQDFRPDMEVRSLSEVTEFLFC